jgi:hypothetical protein
LKALKIICARAPLASVFIRTSGARISLSVGGWCERLIGIEKIEEFFDVYGRELAVPDFVACLLGLQDVAIFGQ